MESLIELKEIADFFYPVPLYNEALFVVEDRIVRDGNIWTSAGISSDIDLALAFVEYMTDEKTADKIQLGTEYYLSGRWYDAQNSADS